MWGRLGPRFAVEAAFLMLLAVGLGLADQDWQVIVAVMAGGWVLVSAVELIAARRPAPQWQRREQAPPAPAPEASEPDPSQEPPADEAPVEPAPEPLPLPAEPVPIPEVAPEPLPQPEPGEETQEVSLPAAAGEPKRRRWFRRGHSDEAAEDGLPEPPKHVRRIDPEEEPAAAEAEER